MYRHPYMPLCCHHPSLKATPPSVCRICCHALPCFTGQRTEWNYAGSGDAYRNVYLDRHDLNQCTGSTGMSAFQMQMQYPPNTALMRMTYACTPTRGPAAAAPVRFTTPANDWGNGNTIYLDRHNVQCASGMLQRWHLYRPSGQIAFEYWCAPVALNTATCQDLTTGWNSNGGGQVNFLDRHPVACPTNKVLTRWQLQTDNPNSLMRIAYRCCGF
jgi:hypothetical protein